jgi:hypothetical protein
VALPVCILCAPLGVQVAGTVGAVAAVAVVVVLAVRHYLKTHRGPAGLGRRAFKHRVIVLSSPGGDTVDVVTVDPPPREDQSRLFYRWADPGNVGARPFYQRHLRGGGVRPTNPSHV